MASNSYSKGLSQIHSRGFTSYLLSRWEELKDSGLKGPVLDLACGDGTFSHRLNQRGIPSIGLDLSFPMLKLCSTEGSPCVQGSLYQLPFSKARSILCLGEGLNYLFEESPNPLKRLSQFVLSASKLLEARGKLIFDAHMIEDFKQEICGDWKVTEGEDYKVSVLFHLENQILTRDIEFEMDTGEKGREIHRTYLYSQKEIMKVIENSPLRLIRELGRLHARAWVLEKPL